MIEFGVAARPRSGEDECGDRHVVRAFAAGVLLGVVDGVGHGRDAAEAARRAAAVLEQHAGEALPVLVERSHQALIGSRGVVMSLASVDHSSTLTWLGVGNVQAVLVRGGGQTGGGEEHMVLRGGVVGSRLPALRVATLALEPGDLLGLATDGVQNGFEGLLRPGQAPQELADEVLAAHGRSSDDALVLVARFLRVER